MNFKLQKICIVITLLSSSLSIFATHYINNTGKTIIVTNVTAKKNSKKSSLKSKLAQNQSAQAPYFIEIENDAEADLDNNQDDEITITSQGMSNKRKLFPTNNSFNYVITMNKYKSEFEQFDINHAGDETKVKNKKDKKNKKRNKKKREQSYE